jgi:hypothetical protein
MSTEVPGSPQEQPPQPPQEQPAAAPPPETPVAQKQEEKTMGMLCHILAFCGLVFPLGNILGPLIIWMVKKDQSAFVNDQGKESLNFQISLVIVGVGLGIVSMVLQVIPIIGQIIGLLLGLAGLAVGIYAIVLIIKGAMKANEGVEYRYPYNFRFIK